jgi:hypothetical protein
MELTHSSKLFAPSKNRKEEIASFFSIELLSDYGWNLGNDRRVFGPGTLFKGMFI